jgi:ABC-type phosphate/phosphonate transport system substrate-binding protein
MKRKLKLIQTGSALALLTLAGCCASSRHASRAWEYRVVEGWSRPAGYTEAERAETVHTFERQLNEAGAQGYAVVSSTTVPGDANHWPKTIVILKRPKQ